MKSELVAPPSFIAKGIEPKNLPAFFQHLLRIRGNLRVKYRLACSRCLLCVAASAPADDAHSDQGERSDRHKQNARMNRPAFGALISFQRRFFAKYCHTVLLILR